MMMTPPNRRHQRIASNLEALLNAALRRHNPLLTAYHDIGVNIVSTVPYDPEPDVAVIREDENPDPRYAERFYLVAEVLSESDKGVIESKRDIYRAHPSCTCILLVRQDLMEIIVERRTGEGWRAQVLHAADELSLREFGLTCPVARLRDTALGRRLRRVQKSNCTEKRRTNRRSLDAGGRDALAAVLGLCGISIMATGGRRRPAGAQINTIRPGRERPTNGPSRASRDVRRQLRRDLGAQPSRGYDGRRTPRRSCRRAILRAAAVRDGVQRGGRPLARLGCRTPCRLAETEHTIFTDRAATSISAARRAATPHEVHRRRQVHLGLRASRPRRRAGRTTSRRSAAARVAAATLGKGCARYRS